MTYMITQIKTIIRTQLVMSYHLKNANSHSKDDEKHFIVVKEMLKDIEPRNWQNVDQIADKWLSDYLY